MASKTLKVLSCGSQACPKQERLVFNYGYGLWGISEPSKIQGNSEKNTKKYIEWKDSLVIWNEWTDTYTWEEVSRHWNFYGQKVIEQTLQMQTQIISVLWFLGKEDISGAEVKKYRRTVRWESTPGMQNWECPRTSHSPEKLAQILVWTVFQNVLRPLTALGLILPHFEWGKVCSGFPSLNPHLFMCAKLTTCLSESWSLDHDGCLRSCPWGERHPCMDLTQDRVPNRNWMPWVGDLGLGHWLLCRHSNTVGQMADSSGSQEWARCPCNSHTPRPIQGRVCFSVSWDLSWAYVLLGSRMSGNVVKFLL